MNDPILRLPGGILGGGGNPPEPQDDYTSLLLSASSLLNGDANNDNAGDANDAIGAFNATWGGTPEYGTAPVGKGSGKSFVLDGTTRYLRQASSAGDYTDDFTVAAWLKPAALADGRVVSKRENSVVAWELYVQADGALILYDGTARLSLSGTVTVNAWNHLAVVINGDASQLYVNGTASGATFEPTISSNSQPVDWGRLPGFGGLAYLAGELYQCGIWGRALTASEVLLLFSGPAL